MTKSPRTASPLPPGSSSAATTQGLRFWGNSQLHPPPLYPSSSAVRKDGHSGCTPGPPRLRSILAHPLPQHFSARPLSSQAGRCRVQGDWKDFVPHQHHFHLDYILVQDDVLIKKKKQRKKKEGLIAFKSLKSTVQDQ